LLRLSLQRENMKLDKLAVEVDMLDPVQVAKLVEVEQRAVLAGFRYII
jgi:hypothetical protein